MEPTRSHECAGIFCALPGELGQLGEAAVSKRRVRGLELLELSVAGRPALACIGGVGKVQAAGAADLLLAEGADHLLVVGTCGSLERRFGPGRLLLCRAAIQSDLATRPGRRSEADAGLLAAWGGVVEAEFGDFLTADRAVFSRLRRWRLRRAFSGAVGVDMETAAVAAVAARAGAPWAALRAVTDDAGWLGPRSFQKHYPVQAGRAADTIPGLLERLSQTAREIRGIGT